MKPRIYPYLAATSFLALTVCNLFGRKIQNYVGTEGLYALGALIAAVALLPLFLLRGKKDKAFYFILLAAMAGANELLTSFLVEKAHIPLYAALTFSVYGTLCSRMSKKWCFFVTFCLCLLIGFFEELSQKYIPDRFYDVRDLLLNFLGIGFGLAASLFYCNRKSITDDY